MSHAHKDYERKIARRKRNCALLIGILFIAFGLEGVIGAIKDLKRGDYTSGTAAASQQPYGSPLRLITFSFLLVMGPYTIIQALRTPTEPDDRRDKSKH